MGVKFYLKNILMSLAVTVSFNCPGRESSVRFSDVCQEDDQAVIQLSGFLVYPQTTPDQSSGNFLLVENNNGTGSFIRLKLTDPLKTERSTEVRVLGQVLKDGTGCVLKVEKIEAR
jgi:hypothetical protein